MNLTLTGWETPAYFEVEHETPMSALAREYQRVTNKCGVVDLSYKGKLEIRGPDAEPFLDHLLTTTIPKVRFKNCHIFLMES